MIQRRKVNHLLQQRRKTLRKKQLYQYPKEKQLNKCNKKWKLKKKEKERSKRRSKDKYCLRKREISISMESLEN